MEIPNSHAFGDWLSICWKLPKTPFDSIFADSRMKGVETLPHRGVDPRKLVLAMPFRAIDPLSPLVDVTPLYFSV